MALFSGCLIFFISPDENVIYFNIGIKSWPTKNGVPCFFYKYVHKKYATLSDKKPRKTGRKKKTNVYP